MSIIEEKIVSQGTSLLSLIRRYKETYLSDSEDSEEDEDKNNPLLLENSLRKYVGNPTFSDVVFLVENEKKEIERIPAHRMLLASRSPVLEAMLYPNPELKQKPTELPKEIHIKDTKSDIFKLLLESIYTDKPKILAKQVVAAVTCSQKYQVSSFQNAIQRYMNRGLSSENACELLMCATNEDRNFAMRFFEENCEDIIQYDPYFTLLKESQIMFIVQSNRLCVSEVELFKGVVRWGKEECKRQKIEASTKNLKALLEKILFHIRFPLMTTEELAMDVFPTDLVSSDDLIAVFTYASSLQMNVGTVGPYCTHPRQATFKGERMKFSPRKSSSSVIISSDGMSVSPKEKSCGRGKVAVTNVPYPKFGVHYFEVTMDHIQGCNDAVGVVKELKVDSRLGEYSDSWAIRVYGVTTDQQRYGAIHENQHKEFFKDWRKGDRIGVKYDAKKKTLSYYQNDKFVGTPFTNVSGEIYPALEVCHGGSLTANFKAVAPRV